jgi:hypothetical protein
MANTWNKAGTTWGYNSWESDTVTVSLTGISITSTLNSDGVVAFNEQGWGSDAWGDENWGESGIDILPTGYSITASLGTLDYAGSIAGWGRDAWGDNNWGENTTTVIVDGLEMTTGLGPGGWGIAPWEEQVSWGGDLSLQTTQLSITTLTGLEATASLGTPQINYDFIFTLSESLLGTLSLGSLTTIPDMQIGVSGFAITGSLGTPTLEMKYPITGYSATMSLGTVSITSNPLVLVSGFAITGSLGSVTVTDMAIGVSGYSITGSLGTTTVTDMAIGVSGLEISGSLGSGGVSPLHYKDVDITGNTSYTDKNITGYTAYTDIEHAG